MLMLTLVAYAEGSNALQVEGKGQPNTVELIRQYARAGSLRHALAVYTSAVHPPLDDASGGGDARAARGGDLATEPRA